MKSANDSKSVNHGEDGATPPLPPALRSAYFKFCPTSDE